MQRQTDMKNGLPLDHFKLAIATCMMTWRCLSAAARVVFFLCATASLVGGTKVTDKEVVQPGHYFQAETRYITPPIVRSSPLDHEKSLVVLMYGYARTTT